MGCRFSYEHSQPSLRARVYRNRTFAFTMVELLAVVVVIGLLVGLLLPAVQSAREGARRLSCSSNLAQIGLAVTGYHNAFDQLPVQLSGTDGSTQVGSDNDRRLSIFVPLTNFVSLSHLANQIDSPLIRTIDDTYASASFSMMGREESQRLSNQETDASSNAWPSGGPEPFATKYPPWYTEISVYRCPSDPGVGLPSMGRNNYAACLGDGVVGASTGAMKEINGRFVVDDAMQEMINVSMRGLFIPRQVTRLADVNDGLAQTIMLGEIATDLGDGDVRTKPGVVPTESSILLRDRPNLARQCEIIDLDRPYFWNNDARQTKVANANGQGRGYRWADGMPLYTSFQTILPPNSEIMLGEDRDDADGVFSASSRHDGGAHVCMADGAVRFVTDSIDAGNASAPTVYFDGDPMYNPASPFGVWGAMGTRSSSELSPASFEPL